MKIATACGSRVLVDEKEVERLRAALRGARCFAPATAAMRRRAPFSTEFSCRPALMARCRAVADVIDAVRFARRHHLLTAVRAGATA